MLEDAGKKLGTPFPTGLTFVLAWSVSAACMAAPAYHTVLDNGPASNRVDIVFLGDGYRAADLGTVYPAHIQAMLHHLFNDGQDPYPRYRNFFNAYSIDVVSKEAGADVPGQGIYRDTALGASYGYDGQTQRLLYVDEAKANAALARGMAGAPFRADMKLVTVNDSRYGGGGGEFACYAGGNTAATEIALHETGHSFDHLADEYGGAPASYLGAAPPQANITNQPDGIKWKQWLGYDQPGVGVIGAYPGAGYYDRGLYRPAMVSKMRALGEPFDAVSREKIILDIYHLVDPLDSWTSNRRTLTDPAQLQVSPIDSAVIDVQWFVDGLPLAGAIGDSFDPLSWGLSAGSHQIMAHAYDPTDWVRIDRSQLEQNISWNVVVTPEPDALGALAAVVLLSRRTRVRK